MTSGTKIIIGVIALALIIWGVSASQNKKSDDTPLPVTDYVEYELQSNDWVTFPFITMFYNKDIKDSINAQLAEKAASLQCTETSSIEESAANEWKSDIKVTKNDSNIFSVTIHSTYYCGGAHPVSNQNDSITFDLTTGKAVAFDELFADYENNLSKIARVIYDVYTKGEVIADCKMTFEQFYDYAFFSYSIKDTNLVTQQILPEVMAFCAKELTIPVEPLTAFLSENSLLKRLTTAQ